jgi:hypothetical protein
MHGWARLLIAEACAVGTILGLDDLEHARQQTVLLHNYYATSVDSHILMGSAHLTLMGHPFTLLDESWLGTQGHEVAFDNEADIVITEEERRSLGALVALESLLVDTHDVGRLTGGWRDASW